MEEMRNAYRIVVGRFRGKKSLGIPNCIWDENININL
jgi:hypothetical protein